MTYFVIGPDGGKYGPADIATLKSWIDENRIGPDTLLESYETGLQQPAKSIAELGFGGGTPPTARPSETNAPGQPPTAGESPYSGAYQRGQFYAPGTIPPQIAGKFNWGAFYFSWIWGLNHRAYLTLISLGLSVLSFIIQYGLAMSGNRGILTGIISLVVGISSIGIQIWYGTQGNKWAWESGRFQTPEDLLRCQKI